VQLTKKFIDAEGGDIGHYWQRNMIEVRALALKAICGIGNMRSFDVDPEATDECIRNLRDCGLSITTCMIGKLCATTLTDNMIGTGVHINAIRR